MKHILVSFIFQQKLNTVISVIALVSALLFAAAPLQAQGLNSYCISCKGPERVYHCKLRSLKPTENARLGTWCVTKISNNFNHNSCTITKINPDICEGRRVTYMYNPAEKTKAADNSRILPNKGKNIASHKAIPEKKLEKTKPKQENKAVKNKKTTLPSENKIRQASITPDRRTSVKPNKRKKIKQKRKKRRRDESFTDKIEREYQETRKAIIRSRKSAVRCIESYFKDC